MARGREGHLGGGGRQDQGYQQDLQHQHPGADQDGQVC